LVAHSADVAAVTWELLQLPVVNSRLARLAGRAKLDETSCSRLACLTFLHDLGKANRGFQARVDPKAPRVGHIQEAFWLLRAESAGSLAERAEEALRYDLIEHWFETEISWGILDAVFAHHGRPWGGAIPDFKHLWNDGEGVPLAVLKDMGGRLQNWFPEAFGVGPCLPSTAEFQHAFAGLVMLADWLGSDTRFFPFANGIGDENRIVESRRRAKQATADVGLDVSRWRDIISSARPTFESAFQRPTPRPMQVAVAEPSASLVVLESETGSGKTEAALWRYAELFRQGLVDGLYFALPTRVAATQIFYRVRTVRDRLFPHGDGPPVVLAVPGQLRVDDVEGRLLPEFKVQWSDASETPERWSAQHPKRFLAAPISVGTIDQALLGTIMTSHAHLRSTALLRHLLVVDEVHATDIYMQGLLRNLLTYHTSAGGHALLLSATLGSALRRDLLGLEPQSFHQAVVSPYPLISWSDGNVERTWSEPSVRQKSIKLSTAPHQEDPSSIASAALAAARQGAKVLIIRNTVNAAIETAAALEALAGADATALFRVKGQATLHHSRFSANDRRLLDQHVERELGGRRSAGARIIVGTQTLEQSLDIDADLLFTDLCPVDVLLQRLGRLHRNPCNERPSPFEQAQAVVIVPANRDLSPFVRTPRHGLGTSKHGGVYEDLFAIEATWRLIEDNPAWAIPVLNRHLVETVTHPDKRAELQAELCSHPSWAGHRDQITGLTKGRSLHGQYALIPFDQPFTDLHFPEDEIFATRLGAADLEVSFPPGLLGPFGQPLGSLRVPGHLHRMSGAVEPTDIVTSATIVSFKLGEAGFEYSRLGLRRL
jgi:CRISPR-associated endonuclease/helicase Cas3